MEVAETAVGPGPGMKELGQRAMPRLNPKPDGEGCRRRRLGRTGDAGGRAPPKHQKKSPKKRQKPRIQSAGGLLITPGPSCASSTCTRTQTADAQISPNPNSQPATQPHWCGDARACARTHGNFFSFLFFCFVLFDEIIPRTHGEACARIAGGGSPQQRRRGCGVQLKARDWSQRT